MSEKQWRCVMDIKDLKSEVNEYVKSETKNLLKAYKESDDDPSVIKNKAEILVFFQTIINLLETQK